MPDINKICEVAGRILDYLSSSFEKDGEADNLFLLSFASGLAGVSCYEAAKAGGAEFTNIEIGTGEKFYFSDKVNEYLFTSEYSIKSCILGFCANVNPGKELPVIDTAMMKIATAIGNPDYLICDMVEPKPLYENSKRCWDDMYESALKDSLEPEDWPLLFGIVVQNIMAKCLSEMPIEQLSQFAFECAIFLSKIGEDTYNK